MRVRGLAPHPRLLSGLAGPPAGQGRRAGRGGGAWGLGAGGAGAGGVGPGEGAFPASLDINPPGGGPCSVAWEAHPLGALGPQETGGGVFGWERGWGGCIERPAGTGPACTLPPAPLQKFAGRGSRWLEAPNLRRYGSRTCSVRRRQPQTPQHQLQAATHLPSTTVRSFQLRILSKQWAAETTQLVFSRVPPHSSAPFSFSMAWQGHGRCWKAAAWGGLCGGYVYKFAPICLKPSLPGTPPPLPWARRSLTCQGHSPLGQTLPPTIRPWGLLSFLFSRTGIFPHGYSTV